MKRVVESRQRRRTDFAISPKRIEPFQLYPVQLKKVSCNMLSPAGKPDNENESTARRSMREIDVFNSQVRQKAMWVKKQQLSHFITYCNWGYILNQNIFSGPCHVTQPSRNHWKQLKGSNYQKLFWKTRQIACCHRNQLRPRRQFNWYMKPLEKACLLRKNK